MYGLINCNTVEFFTYVKILEAGSPRGSVTLGQGCLEFRSQYNLSVMISEAILNVFRVNSMTVSYLQAFGSNAVVLVV